MGHSPFSVPLQDTSTAAQVLELPPKGPVPNEQHIGRQWKLRTSLPYTCPRLKCAWFIYRVNLSRHVMLDLNETGEEHRQLGTASIVGFPRKIVQLVDLLVEYSVPPLHDTVVLVII